MHSEDFEQLKNDLSESHVRFGKFLRAWRLSCGWSQETAMHWGRETGMPHVYGSKWSLLEGGRMSAPGAWMFVALEVMNKRLHEKDFSGVSNRDLSDRLKNGIAILNEDGTPWKAGDYFNAWIGIKNIPEQFRGDGIDDLECKRAVLAIERELNKAKVHGMNTSTLMSLITSSFDLDEAEKEAVCDAIVYGNKTFSAMKKLGSSERSKELVKKLSKMLN